MSVGAIAGVGGIAGVAGTTGASGAAAAAPGQKVDFSAGLQAVERSLQQADSLGAKAATGELKDIHEFMAASSKANLAVELTVAVRNKAVEAYQEIMRMQV
jgi:flagellar hook-basal body complex protein FliE